MVSRALRLLPALTPCLPGLQWTLRKCGMNELARGRPLPPAWLCCTIQEPTALPRPLGKVAWTFLLSGEDSSTAAGSWAVDQGKATVRGRGRVPLRSGRAAPPLTQPGPLVRAGKPQNWPSREVPDATLASAPGTYLAKEMISCQHEISLPFFKDKKKCFCCREGDSSLTPVAAAAPGA